MSLAFVPLACGGEEAPPPQAPPVASVAPPPPPPASTTPAPPPPPPKPPLADLIQSSLKTLGDATAAHDAAKFGSVFTDDATFDVYGAADMKGRDGIVKGAQGWYDMSSDLKGAPRRVFEKGNVVVSEMVWTGTMTGDFMGLKATKKPFGTAELVVLSFDDDGHVTSFHDYFDGPGFMMQLKGSAKAPPLQELPAGPPETHVAKGTPDEDKLVDWAKTFNDAFDKDAKTLDALFAPDADVTFAFLGGKVMKGKELMAMNADAFKAFPKATWTLANAWGIDGYVVVERSMSGAWKGRLGPLAATGKNVTLHIAEIIQPTADGKVQHGWAYGNLAEIMPPPPAPKAAPAAKPSRAAKPAKK